MGKIGALVFICTISYVLYSGKAFHLPTGYFLKSSRSSVHASKAKDIHFSSTSRVSPDEATQSSICGLKAPGLDTSFVVFGEPMPLQRHRVLRSGISYNPSSKLQNEFSDACAKGLPDVPLEGPLEVRMVFYFKRPLAHYGTGKNKAVLKTGMDIWHSKRKDIDNLAKFVLDAINKKAYLDDGQVSILSTAKLYTEAEPRIEVRIRKLGDEDVMFRDNFINE